MSAARQTPAQRTGTLGVYVLGIGLGIVLGAAMCEAAEGEERRRQGERILAGLVFAPPASSGTFAGDPPPFPFPSPFAGDQAGDEHTAGG